MIATRRFLQLLALLIVIASQTGCVGMAVEAATDLTIAAAKVPFKVGGAVIDLATDDEHEQCQTDHINDE